jgi:hypothetical protein
MMFCRNWLADMLPFIMLSSFPIDVLHKFLMDIPSWEDDNHWASQIPCLSWDPKVLSPYWQDRCQFNASILHPVSVNSILYSYYLPFHFFISQTNLFPQCLLPRMSILLLSFSTYYIVCVCVCVHVCMYVYIYIYMCVFVYTHTHTHTHIYIYIFINNCIDHILHGHRF